MHHTQDPGQSALRMTHKEPTGSSCQSIPKITMQVPDTVDFYAGVVLV